jgi:hypothetical protein
MPTATATQTPVPTGWRGEYYANAGLEGEPAVVRTDGDIGFDWTNEAPAEGIPAEGFSVRWSRVAAFEQGLYHFHASMDDGMRVYLDDELLVDEWRDRSEREVIVSRNLAAGNHALRVEYYNVRHRALANVWWEKDAAYPDWKGMYWANQDMLGNPTMMRNDPEINFDWQMGSPGAAIPDDHFSARWTRTEGFEEGLYRFTVLADDGVRIWVDGRLILDAWTDHQQHELTVDHTMAGAGAHAVRVEYYDNTFHARAHVSFAKVAPPAYSGWKGEYFDNPYLSGVPLLVRNDDTLIFDWEWGAPAPNLPVDDFSVRWTLEKEFDPGIYRFTFQVDDGVRFHVDDELVLNEWHQTWNETYEVEVKLSWKPKLVVEMLEQAGDARIRVSWARIK